MNVIKYLNELRRSIFGKVVLIVVTVISFTFITIVIVKLPAILPVLQIYDEPSANIGSMICGVSTLVVGTVNVVLLYLTLIGQTETSDRQTKLFDATIKYYEDQKSANDIIRQTDTLKIQKIQSSIQQQDKDRKVSHYCAEINGMATIWNALYDSDLSQIIESDSTIPMSRSVYCRIKYLVINADLFVRELDIDRELSMKQKKLIYKKISSLYYSYIKKAYEVSIVDGDDEITNAYTRIQVLATKNV